MKDDERLLVTKEDPLRLADAALLVGVILLVRVAETTPLAEREGAAETELLMVEMGDPPAEGEVEVLPPGVEVGVPLTPVVGETLPEPLADMDVDKVDVCEGAPDTVVEGVGSGDCGVELVVTEAVA